MLVGVLKSLVLAVGTYLTYLKRSFIFILGLMFVMFSVINLVSFITAYDGGGHLLGFIFFSLLGIPLLLRGLEKL